MKTNNKSIKISIEKITSAFGCHFEMLSSPERAREVLLCLACGNDLCNGHCEATDEMLERIHDTPDGDTLNSLRILIEMLPKNLSKQLIEKGFKRADMWANQQETALQTMSKNIEHIHSHAVGIRLVSVNGKTLN